MRKTFGEIVDMGREAFLDAMLEELKQRAERPGLSAEERQRLQARVAKAAAAIEKRRAQRAAQPQVKTKRAKGAKRDLVRASTRTAAAKR
jgi:hypothetical protein